MSTLSVLTEDAELLTSSIRDLLQRRCAMHIGELRMCLGVDITAVQAVLEKMMTRGEVERLRPVDYSQADHDFFRVNSVVGMLGKSE